MPLPVVWDEGENAKVSSASIAAWLKEGLEDRNRPSSAIPGRCESRARRRGEDGRGDLRLSLPEPRDHGADERHRSGRPRNARVWTGTQNGEAAFNMTVAASGLPPEKCEVYKQMLGGGFGRRGNSISCVRRFSSQGRCPARPVKLLWSREEDMQQGKYHPTTQARLVAGLDKGQQPHGAADPHIRASRSSPAQARGAGQRHGHGDLCRSH